MSSKTIYKYRIYCVTENKYQYIWSDSQPTTCPVNTADTVDTNTVSIVDTISNNNVNIIQENIATNGNYRTESKKMVINANNTATMDLSWKYPISVLNMNINTEANNESDILNLYIAPDTTIGVLTAPSSIGTNTLTVNNTVIDNLKIGYRVSVTNGTVTTDYGECLAINRSSNTIECENNSTNAFAAGSFVRMTINNIKAFVLKGNSSYELARKTIGASYLPANTIVRVSYTNTSLTAKSFFFSLEYLY